MKAQHKNLPASLQELSEQNLKQLSEKVFKGCGCIYHMQGYMNSKGDAPYDFTCDRSHRCSKCSQQYTRIMDKLNSIAEEIQLKENTKLVQAKLQKTRAKYFEPKQGCECTINSMCKPCFQLLQNEATRLQSGCGKQWEQQFGGMAAGPAYVTCFQNYFLCDTCSEELAFINKVNKEYPWAVLKHIPEGQKDFWKGPSQKPYYAGIL